MKCITSRAPFELASPGVGRTLMDVENVIRMMAPNLLSTLPVFRMDKTSMSSSDAALEHQARIKEEITHLHKIVDFLVKHGLKMKPAEASEVSGPVSANQEILPPRCLLQALLENLPVQPKASVLGPPIRRRVIQPLHQHNTDLA
eukprot:m.94053 g.94053  ORF g.94053 m.94053 type:complete len:145 (-) comp15002_c0_seq3:103-537(-)